LLGDFNLTEDNLDHAPARHNDLNAVGALQTLRHQLDVQDSWRHAYPNERCFTYHANTNGQQIQSHLDRIYTARPISNLILEWKTIPTAIPTDHSLVLTKYSPANAPTIGKGRWTCHTHALDNEDLIVSIEKHGLMLEDELRKLDKENTPHDTATPQTLWKTFKEDLKTLIKQKSEKSHHKMNSKIRKLRVDQRILANHPDIDEDDGA
jgi:hypothetical protein